MYTQKLPDVCFQKPNNSYNGYITGLSKILSIFQYLSHYHLYSIFDRGGKSNYPIFSNFHRLRPGPTATVYNILRVRCTGVIRLLLSLLLHCRTRNRPLDFCNRIPRISAAGSGGYRYIFAEPSIYNRGIRATYMCVRVCVCIYNIIIYYTRVCMSCKYKICEDVFCVPRVYYVYNNNTVQYRSAGRARNYHLGGCAW